MERSSTLGHGSSWADQWDYSNPDPIVQANGYEKKKKSGGGGGGTKKKVEEGLVKTKAVASTGFKKVKEGTTFGFYWIKNKYNKRTQKNY
ncbi:hypothetical protein GIB67_039058 [Kingdonia uniflora]|uniref:Uncharacterized protein n=1 Tax=Kingdonia uniflora TaxID=39325 RepID=A0A7J7LKT1_9MAGN|nr:hypothetical protein GIB67_039058 [Kingdonia uniflora]